MDLSFYKLRVCDADLLLVDDLEGGGRDRAWDSIARALLHRRRGAGADRLAVLSRAESALWLRVFSVEGEGGCCADAALCAARYLLDSGRSGAEAVTLRSSCGSIVVDVLDSTSLGIALGPPRALPGGEELSPAAAAARASSVESSGERFLVLPLRAGLPGSDAAAVFAEGGAARTRARIASSRGSSSPTAVVVRVVSRGELIASAPAGAGLDSCATAAVALAAAAAVGYSDREAMVRLRSGALWLEWAARGGLYAAARPEYVYRGEFHVTEAHSGK